MHTIEDKLAVVDELIKEYRESRSLWSVKKQLESIRKERNDRHRE